MAARKRKSARTKTRTVYRAAPRRRSYRRKSSYNASVTKKTAALGAGIGLGSVALPIAISAIQNKSLTPITSAFTDKNKLVEMGKNAIVGYAVGYAGGVVLDKTGLKKPVNKLVKKIGL